MVMSECLWPLNLNIAPVSEEIVIALRNEIIFSSTQVIKFHSAPIVDAYLIWICKVLQKHCVVYDSYHISLKEVINTKFIFTA